MTKDQARKPDTLHGWVEGDAGDVREIEVNNQPMWPNEIAAWASGYYPINKVSYKFGQPYKEGMEGCFEIARAGRMIQQAAVNLRAQSGATKPAAAQHTGFTVLENCQLVATYALPVREFIAPPLYTLSPASEADQRDAKRWRFARDRISTRDLFGGDSPLLCYELDQAIDAAMAQEGGAA